jgi:hypothetical protein
MAIATKPISDAANFWLQGATNRAARYVANGAAAGGKWLTGAVAGVPMYKSAVTAGDIDRRMLSGLNRAGSQGYSNGINKKGQANFTNGLQAGQAKYQAAEGAMLQVIQGVTLNTRALRGSTANYANVQKVGDALHAASVARKTA